MPGAAEFVGGEGGCGWDGRVLFEVVEFGFVAAVDLSAALEPGGLVEFLGFGGAERDGLDDDVPGVIDPDDGFVVWTAFECHRYGGAHGDRVATGLVVHVVQSSGAPVVHDERVAGAEADCPPGPGDSG